MSSRESEDETTEEPTAISEQTSESSSILHRASPYPLRTREPKRQWDELLLSTSEDPGPYEPKNLKDAMSAPDATLWKEAVNDEYDSLINNKTWSLTKLPLNRTAIKSRWIFKVKPGVKGSAPRYKAKLVAKGYSQRPGIDYEETFAPVTKQTTLRVVLSFVAAQDLEMRQLDIKTAFLYGDLSEEIYMKQPKGYVKSGDEDLVCRLHKCLYGLKQASRVWNHHLTLSSSVLNSNPVNLIHFFIRAIREPSSLWLLSGWTTASFVVAAAKPLTKLSAI